MTSLARDLSGNAPYVKRHPVDVIEGSFAGTGQSSSLLTNGKANVLIDANGATATVSIEKSFDGGTTWEIVSRDSAGNPATYAVATLAFNGTIEEAGESEVLYRLNCSAHSSGTVLYRMSLKR